MRHYILLAVALTFMLSACNNQKQGRSIMPGDTDLQVGDIVFRGGEGMTSRIVMKADNDGIYSHVGIVIDSAGCKMIVHAVPDEHDFPGDFDRVKMEKPDGFFNEVKAKCGEVLRHKDKEAAQRAAQEAIKLYKKKVPFDHDYDDTDTTSMYCTEMVTYVYRKAGAPLQGIQHHDFRFFSLETRCVLPSDILNCKDLRRIKVF